MICEVDATGLLLCDDCNSCGKNDLEILNYNKEENENEIQKENE